MLKKTIIFSKAYSLSLQHRQIVCIGKDIDFKETLPIEDIGVILIENMRTNITLPLLAFLSQNNVSVIFCNKNHFPESMLLSFTGHHLQEEIVEHQIIAKKPLKKQLWKKIIEAKIENQYLLTKKFNRENRKLFYLKSEVESGDPKNKEGIAAKYYWESLFSFLDFKRERFGMFPNNLLNYGYAILRAAVARAVTASGLLPVVGLHHHNKYNAFCLVDDLIEPYRPYVDEIVCDLIYSERYSGEALTTDIKSHLLEVLSDDVVIGKVKRPLESALSITTASLANSFKEKKMLLECPKFK